MRDDLDAMVRSAVRVVRLYEAMTAHAGACCEAVAERKLRKWNQTLKMAPPLVVSTCWTLGRHGGGVGTPAEDVRLHLGMPPGTNLLSKKGVNKSFTAQPQHHPIE